jgi:hypothetical protein
MGSSQKREDRGYLAQSNSRVPNACVKKTSLAALLRPSKGLRREKRRGEAF